MSLKVIVQAFLLSALLIVAPLQPRSLSETLVDEQEQANAPKTSFEEKLLATIPSDYKEPGVYGIYPGSDAIWYYVVTFEPRGGGWTPILSPDGEQIVYRAKQGNKQFIVIGNKKGPEFDEVRYPVFSPDGSKLAYAAKLNKRWFSIVGEQKGPEFDEIGPPVFSPDGSKIAYGAQEGKKEFIILDGQRGKEFEQVSSPLFDPTGKSIAYVALQKDMSYLYVNEKLVAQYRHIGDVTFSPDGSKIAYAAYKDDWFIVVGDKVGPKYFIALAPTFSPDGSKVAYVACKTDWGSLKCFIVIGDEVGKGFHVGVSLPVFSPDGSRVVYVGSTVDDQFLVTGNKQEKTKCEPLLLINRIMYTGVESRQREVFLSPDGTKVACKVRDYNWKRKWLISASGQLSLKFDEVGTPIFSPDGRKILFWARQGKEIWRKVMDIQ